MRIRSPFSAALSNPLVDTVLGLNAVAQLVPLFKGTDHSQEFVNAAEANGAPVTSMPGGFFRRALSHTGLVSPNIQASPDQLNQEKIALGNQAGQRLSSYIKLRAQIGESNLEALKKQNPGMFQGMPDLVAPTPAELKMDKPNEYGDWRKLHPNADPTDYNKATRTPQQPNEATLFLTNRPAWEAMQADKQKYQKQPTDTETPIPPADIITGPDGKAAGVWMKSKGGKPHFAAMPGAVPKAQKDPNAPKQVDPTLEKGRRVNIVKTLGGEWDKAHPIASHWRTKADNASRKAYIQVKLGGVDPDTYVNRADYTPPSATPYADMYAPPSK